MKKPRAAKPQAKQWWSEGIQFQCQGSGKCCTSHGEFGFVFLTKEDRARMAAHFGMTSSAFTRKYCDKLADAFHLKEDPKNLDCMFLKNKQCSIYDARPVQCRTWPFWPEVMNAKAWKKEVVDFCPGVGKGRLWSAEEIQKNLDEQIRSETAP
ncbi:MAG: YkgJ family cysteine cluster protein [Bdellovibrio sp.]|jgi:Fe-S-cluster containining protein